VCLFRWWEGIVKGLNKDDKNKITVHFPGLLMSDD